MQTKNLILAELYNKHKKRIFDFLFKFVNNSEIAMDLVQDTFVSFIKSYGDEKLSEEKSLMLLYTIARNSSINYGKKFSTLKESSGDVDVFSANNSISLERRQELNDMEQRLYFLLSKFPEDQKTAFLLKNIEDLTLVQIAEIMDISVSTASRLVIKATSTLIEMAKTEGISIE
ncbi:MAG: sigma-70 family RNA polymerase sigma factor [Leptospiraceae bacterium]|nr:sigma-70 family RNA polymerase sigma factor [Leptospiraceae bacterium]